MIVSEAIRRELARVIAKEMISSESKNCSELLFELGADQVDIWIVIKMMSNLESQNSEIDFMYFLNISSRPYNYD